MSVEKTSPPTPPTPSARPGRGWLLLGVLCAIAGVGLYVAQIQAHLLFVPWYSPILATLGAGCVAWALCQARSGVRIGLLLLLALFAGLQWHMFGIMFRSPAYTGPIQVGKAFPDFACQHVDGTAFTQADLQGKQRSLVLFFRGRW